MSPASDNRRDASSDDEATTPTVGEYPTVSPAIEIYEDDIQVGVVDLEAETFEYDGTYDELRNRLELLAAEGYWTHINGKVQLEGIGIGRKLMKSINRNLRYWPESDAKLKGVPVGFDSQYEKEPSESAEKTLKQAAIVASSMPEREQSSSESRVPAPSVTDDSAPNQE